MTWTRGPNGWVAVEASGDTVPGDSIAVEALLRRLRGLRVARFRDTRSAGDAKFLGTIALWRPDDSPLATLDFTRLDDDSVEVDAPVPGRFMIVAENLDDLFSHTTTELRDRRLLQFAAQDAMRMEIVLPGFTGSLVRTAGHWAYPNPSLGPILPDRAADLVRALRALKWDQPGRTASEPESRYHILIRNADGAILDEMHVAPVEGASMWPVTSRSSGGNWLIEKSSLDHLVSLFRQLKGR